MGHFTIDLPEKKKGDARWGIVSNTQFPLIRKNKSESKQGYIVNVSDTDGKIEFRLFKSQNGEWSKDPEGKIGLDNETLIFIKNAIIEKELKDA
ncbi:MAG TPA: hypothetical protein VKI61_13255 [Chitinophagaceae bacterium]|jgi:hypothetical protein|nr:hypothetical protein [Chitinophagaceae bacterium]